MDKKTKKLIKQRESNKIDIDRLKSDNEKITIEMCEIEGPCPHCRNWHYPHCGT